jgi:hypothetical protein
MKARRGRIHRDGWPYFRGKGVERSHHTAAFGSTSGRAQAEQQLGLQAQPSLPTPRHARSPQKKLQQMLIRDKHLMLAI